MTWYAIPSLLTISLLIMAIQWKWMLQAQPKEKIVHFSLLATGWVLGILLMLFPHLPGPSQFVDAVFGRIGNVLIHNGKAER